MLKDYYAILSVPRDADRKKIQRAYRALARRCHPDLCTEADHEQFTEVHEAYETLGDDKQRQQYDRALAQAQTCSWRHAFSSTLSKHYTGVKEPVSEVQNLVDDFFHHLFEEPSRSRTTERMELVLDPEEARRGGTFHIDLGVPKICPVCKERPLVQLFCKRCQGLGSISVLKKVTVVVPPGIMPGSELIVSVSEEDTEREVRVVVCVEQS
jgi:DnaJ-class molecular chaperone